MNPDEEEGLTPEEAEFKDRLRRFEQDAMRAHAEGRIPTPRAFKMFSEQWMKRDKEERPSLTSRFSEAAGQSLVELAADLRDAPANARRELDRVRMLLGGGTDEQKIARRERFRASEQAAREQAASSAPLRQGVEALRREMPEARGFGERAADFLGAAAPDIAAITATSAIGGLTGGSTAPLALSRAGRLGRVAMGALKGTAAATPGIIVPSALSEESMRSPSNAAVRYAKARADARARGVQEPELGMVTGALDRALTGLGNVVGDGTGRSNFGDRLMADLGIDLTLGLGGEVATRGIGKAYRGLRNATDFGSTFGEGLEAGARGAREAVEGEAPYVSRAVTDEIADQQAQEAAETAARQNLRQAEREAAARVNEFQRTLTQAKAESHRGDLRRAAARAMGEPLPSDPGAVTTGQQSALEALRRRDLRGMAGMFGAPVGAAAAMGADDEGDLARAGLIVPFGSRGTRGALARSLGRQLFPTHRTTERGILQGLIGAGGISAPSTALTVPEAELLSFTERRGPMALFPNTEWADPARRFTGGGDLYSPTNFEIEDVMALPDNPAELRSLLKASPNAKSNEERAVASILADNLPSRVSDPDEIEASVAAQVIERVSQSMRPGPDGMLIPDMSDPLVFNTFKRELLPGQDASPEQVLARWLEVNAKEMMAAAPDDRQVLSLRNATEVATSMADDIVRNNASRRIYDPVSGRAMEPTPENFARAKTSRIMTPSGIEPRGYIFDQIAQNPMLATPDFGRAMEAYGAKRLSNWDEALAESGRLQPHQLTSGWEVASEDRVVRAQDAITKLLKAAGSTDPYLASSVMDAVMSGGKEAAIGLREGLEFDPAELIMASVRDIDPGLNLSPAALRGIRRNVNKIATEVAGATTKPVQYFEQFDNDVLRARDLMGAIVPEDRPDLASALARETPEGVPIMTYPRGADDAATSRTFLDAERQLLGDLRQSNVIPDALAAALGGAAIAGSAEEGSDLDLALGTVMSGRLGRNVGKRALARAGMGAAKQMTTRLTRAIEQLPDSWSDPRPLVDWQNLRGSLPNISDAEMTRRVLPFVEANGGKATAEEVLQHLKGRGVQSEVKPTFIGGEQDMRTAKYPPQYGVHQRNEMMAPYGEDVALRDVPHSDPRHFTRVARNEESGVQGWSRWEDTVQPDGSRTRTIIESQSDYAQDIARKGIMRRAETPEDHALLRQNAEQAQARLDIAENQRNAAYKAYEDIDREYENGITDILKDARALPSPLARVMAGATGEFADDMFPSTIAAIDNIVSGLGGKREAKLRQSLKTLLHDARIDGMRAGDQLAQFLYNPREASAINDISKWHRHMMERSFHRADALRTKVEDQLVTALGKMSNVAGSRSRLATLRAADAADEIARAFRNEMGDAITAINNVARQRFDQSLSGTREQYVKASKAYEAIDEAVGAARRDNTIARYDEQTGMFNAMSPITGPDDFTSTFDTTITNTAITLLRALDDGVSRIAIDTPKSRMAQASLSPGAATMQYGINLPKAVEAIHKALGVSPKWSDGDGVRQTFEITPELGSAIRRVGVPVLTAAAMAIEEDEERGQYLSAGLDGLDITLMLALGGAAGARALLRRAASAGASEAAQQGINAELKRLALEVATEEAEGRTIERIAAQRATGAERIRDFTAPYPKDVADPVKDQQTLLNYAGKIITDAGGNAEMREIAEQMVQEGQITAQGRVPWEVEEELATMLAMNKQDLATRDPSRSLNGTELLALGKLYTRDVRRRALALRAAQDLRLPMEQRAVARDLAHALEERIFHSFQRLTRDRSQKGRDLNLLKKAWMESSDPTDWLFRAQKLAGGRPLSEKLASEIIDALNRQDFDRAKILVGKARNGELGDKWSELFQVNLLASIPQRIRDLFSNSVQAADRATQYKLAGYMDAGLGAITGHRSYGNTGAIRMASKMKGAAKRGAEQAVALVRGGAASPEQSEALRRAAARYDFLAESSFQNPILRAYSTVVRRMIGAADQPYYEIAMAMAIESQAMARAEREGFKGLDLIRAADRYASSPTPEMQLRAVDEAREAVWQNATVLGEATKALGGRNAKSHWVRAVGKTVIPFAQTPSSMWTQAMKQSPLNAPSAAMNAVKLMRGIDVPENQRQLVKKLAAMGTGAAWIYAGFAAADAGVMTGEYPADAQERAKWEAEGRTPNSILKAGKWVGLSGLLGPQAILMAIGHQMHEFMQEDMSLMTSMAGASALGGATALMDAPMMQGISSLAEMGEAVRSQDTGRIAQAGDRMASSFAGGLVPQFVAQAAQGMDTDAAGNVISRDLSGGNRMVNAVKSRIPGARETLPERVDVFGETVTQGGGPIESMLNPMRMTPDRSDALTQALDKSGYFPSKPRPTAELDAAAQRALRVANGPEERALLEALLAEDEAAWSFVSPETIDEFNQTGDIGKVFEAAIRKLRTLQTRARKESNVP